MVHRKQLFAKLLMLDAEEGGAVWCFFVLNPFSSGTLGDDNSAILL